MEKTKQTILIVNRKNLNQSDIDNISSNFTSDGVVMSGYGIEIWEKDLITGELKLLREDNEKIGKTERIKLGDLEIERPVEDKDPFDDIFVEKHKQKELPKRKKRKYTKKKKPNHIPRKKVKYTDEIVQRVKEVINEKSNPEIADLLRIEFGINVSVPSVANMLWTRNIKRKKMKLKTEIQTPEFSKPRVPKCSSTKSKTENSKRKGMSEEAITIIEDNYMEMTDGELREKIADKTGAFHPADKIEAYRESNGMARPEGWNPEDYDDDYPEEED